MAMSVEWRLQRRNRKSERVALRDQEGYASDFELKEIYCVDLRTYYWPRLKVRRAAGNIVSCSLMSV